MGFPVSYGGLFPEVLLTTAISIVAIRDLYRAFLGRVGLHRENDDTEPLWLFTGETQMLDSASLTLGSCAEAIKESLPPVLFERVLDRKNLENAQCAVCLNDLDRGQEVRQLPHCCHIFHKECIDRWLARDQTTCPLCRSSLLIEELAEKLKQREWELSEEMNFWFPSFESGSEGTVEQLFPEWRNPSIDA